VTLLLFFIGQHIHIIMKSTIKRNMNIAKYKITNCAGGRHNMSPPLQVDLWPFDLKSGVWVTCDVGYLCANFSLPRPLCFQLRPMCTRQTDRRQTSDRKTSDEHRCLMPPTLGAGHDNKTWKNDKTSKWHPDTFKHFVPCLVATDKISPWQEIASTLALFTSLRIAAVTRSSADADKPTRLLGRFAFQVK